MILYMYNKNTGELFFSAEAEGYDAENIYLSDSTIAMDENMELSMSPELNQTLRADWKAKNPEERDRVKILEAIVADLLFGGETE